RVRDTRNDEKSEKEMVKVIGMNNSFAWPSRKTVGRKTTIVVMVETKIGIATSRAASSTAVRRSLPGIARWRLMFSSSTMESSTRRPTASARPPRVKMLSVWQRKYIAISVHMNDRGMATEIITVESTLRRKIKMTRNASAAPWTDSCQRLSIDWRMYVDWSKINPTFTPGGTRSSLGRRFRTPS